MSRFFVSNLIILCLLVLAACGHKPAEHKPVYKTELPEKMSPQFALFLEDYLTSIHEKIQSNEDYSIYARSYTPKVEDRVTYFNLHKADIEESYEKLKRSNTPSKTFHNLLRKTDWNDEPEMDEAKLPVIQSEKKDTLTIRTEKGEKQFTFKDLRMMDDFSAGVEFYLLASTKEDLLLEIGDNRDGTYPLLFAKQDMSETMIVKNEKVDLEKAYASGKLDRYDSLMEQMGSGDAFERVKGTSVIFDKEKKKPINVKDSDTVSDDGEQVYVNGALSGADTEEGMQKVVDIDSYIKESDSKGKTFDIDGKTIAKLAGIDVKKPDLHAINIEYFTKDFVVLRLEFSSFISMIGGTNLIVDLSGDEPEMYVIDLDYR